MIAAIELSQRAGRFLKQVKQKMGLKSGSGSDSINRYKHLVVSGETVDNLAQACLGDERLAGLIITINRSSIIFDRHGVALVSPGTTLDLPAKEEVRIFRENYLLDSRTSEIPKVSVNSKFLSTIRIGVIDKFTQETDDDANITKLSEGCRIFVGAQGPIGTQFSVKLQAAFHSGYMTIAAYESILGRTRRVIFKPDGSCNQLDVDLPAEIAKEMAKRDFHRNWQGYYNGYFLSPSSSALPSFSSKLAVDF